MEIATYGAGCFWCVEAIFSELKGVTLVESGYSGGHVQNPTYEEVCSGTTGHAEVCQIHFDPEIISYNELLEVFWHSHDPTTINRQGADVGPQYRSVIFYHSEIQQKQAEELKIKLNTAGNWDQQIVTEITPYEAFYAAEDYHQDYYRQHHSQPYCSLVITPKLKKFREVFDSRLKKIK